MDDLQVTLLELVMSHFLAFDRHGLYYLFFSTHAFDHAQYNVSLKSLSCNVELH